MALLSIPLVLALGCQRAEEGGEQMEAESSMMETSSLSLMALNESGVTGTADLSHTEETMTVNLELSGLTPGETYAAHIHRGSCETQGPVAASLGSVTAAEDGTGTIEASVSMSELGAMEGHGEGMMEEGHGEGMMEEGQGEGMMEEGQGEGMMEEGMEQGMKEGMSAQHMGFYIQAHLPDGTPAACADIKVPETS
ncbi:MAG: superoxide dismutase family protein [Gemmatimonadetes bacterium]|uniref:Superoxide dismutase family protein n=1 Tax=Candidatus Kutchimonas denitrificans TaxID=3056748 RepID=A0AAE4Z6X5_9BACT|nr:superoxide dismutase family protein [Gemmatimonadota bacterium]NIR73582.1 superoxide dismutase family protein [Candidatus Kutchimonas denitrificans]NIR99541.1 superoxide dismutase family protein [Gemmatimonadota bacterium]NIT65161.1 superoxide dismutase family protein [Gemmatimonadota bacterium]NIV23694.1 CHRD domain-containing protein [Gemmatimonadota bacterium]